MHCKAGRGRSNIIVLYHLVKTTGDRPESVHLKMKEHRGHIVRKWNSVPVQQLWSELGHEDDGSVESEKPDRTQVAVAPSPPTRAAGVVPGAGDAAQEDSKIHSTAGTARSRARKAD